MFIFSTVDGHLGAVWPGVTMTKTARNTVFLGARVHTAPFGA